jgi:hypothetical protein
MTLLARTAATFTLLSPVDHHRAVGKLIGAISPGVFPITGVIRRATAGHAGSSMVRHSADVGHCCPPHERREAAEPGSLRAFLVLEPDEGWDTRSDLLMVASTSVGPREALLHGRSQDDPLELRVGKDVWYSADERHTRRPEPAHAAAARRRDRALDAAGEGRPRPALQPESTRRRGAADRHRRDVRLPVHAHHARRAELRAALVQLPASLHGTADPRPRGGAARRP